MKPLVVIASIVILAFTNNASASNYFCTVESVVMPHHTKKVNAYWQKVYRGMKFSIERETGLMKGDMINALGTARPQVIDHARNNENSYKVVTVAKPGENGPGSGVIYLNIAEHEEGRAKRMLLVRTDQMITGHCTSH